LESKYIMNKFKQYYNYNNNKEQVSYVSYNNFSIHYVFSEEI